MFNRVHGPPPKTAETWKKETEHRNIQSAHTGNNSLLE